LLIVHIIPLAAEKSDQFRSSFLGFTDHTDSFPTSQRAWESLKAGTATCCKSMVIVHNGICLNLNWDGF
ncbi:unnamed protein product, partial [Brassica oleracea var. botrytis]